MRRCPRCRILAACEFSSPMTIRPAAQFWPRCSLSVAHRMAQSASAAEASSLIRKANDLASPFDLMLIDQRMPQMDGLEMLQVLESARLAASACGADGQLDRIERRPAADAGSRLAPLHFQADPASRFFATICRDRSAPANSSRSAAAALIPVVNHPPAENSRALRILLADDSPDNRLVVKAFLQKTSFQIDEAENGQRVVGYVKNNRYDVILMDIQMPLLDGFAATRAIREWERAQGLPQVPIIALTASALDEDVQRAREAGCNLHVSKPIKKKTLLSAIAQLTSDGAEPARPFSMIAL